MHVHLCFVVSEHTASSNKNHVKQFYQKNYWSLFLNNRKSCLFQGHVYEKKFRVEEFCE